MALDTGDIVELEVTKVVHGGDGLARHDGFVIFVHGGLPGERVLARVYSVKKSHAFADLIEVLVPSNHRVTHIWPEADVSRAPEARAGGADYGHIALDYQRVLKTDILREALTRYGGVSEDFVRSVHVEPVNGSADALRWRHRVTLHVDNSGLAGPYAERTHRVIAVDSLPLAASSLEALGVHHGDWSGHKQIRLVQSSTGQPRVIIDSQKPQALTEKVGDDVFHLSDHSFWQVHHSAAHTLDALVSEALSEGLAGGRGGWLAGGQAEGGEFS
ncbi:MAG: TRAM domain-containing protein, partial [Pontimonas sp.]